MDPNEKPGVRWVDWCSILPAWLGCFSERGAWDPLTVTGSVETGCRESGLFFLVLVYPVQHDEVQALIHLFEHVQRQLQISCPSTHNI